MGNNDLQSKKKDIKPLYAIITIIAAAFIVISMKIFNLAGTLSLCAFALLLILLGFNIKAEIKGNIALDEGIKDKSQAKKDRCFIVIFIVGIRILWVLFAYLSARFADTVQGGFLQSFRRIWLNSGIDAPSYLGIAENWYQTQGDPMYHIVFFPFFPILIKLFWFLCRDYLMSALIVNMLASIGAGLMAYELAKLDFDRKTALNFVKYIFILPASFFYAAPMTESVFLLLALLCLYFARKKNFLLCGMFGALCAFTRSQGVLLALPCAYIAFSDFIMSIKNTDSKKESFCKLLRDWCSCALIFSGLCGYLYINHAVWGNAFQFSIFQREHWSQSLGFFPNTVNMIGDRLVVALKNASGRSFFVDYDMKLALALWLPQLLYIFASLFVMILTARKIHSSYTLFFAAYFAVSIGATWLLSAPRYLMACVSLPLSLSVLAKNKKSDILLTCICCVFGAIYLFMYAVSSPIY